ncbi:MAG: hypothetical protein CSA20_02370 [Deltaproteobacteria bacterium]|nr:MAG: hypothetical protein CSA20_02370 [Deltaproteobacteria bacterium]
MYTIFQQPEKTGEWMHPTKRLPDHSTNGRKGVTSFEFGSLPGRKPAVIKDTTGRIYLDDKARHDSVYLSLA